MFGDRNEQEVQEVALIFSRLAPGQEQIEIRSEAQPTHKIAAEIPASHFDCVCYRNTDFSSGCARFTDLHGLRFRRNGSVSVALGC
ncbi:hypothetical protein GCM10010837_15030 [Aminobacter niigataensis]